jgi:hypothetical protein
MFNSNNGFLNICKMFIKTISKTDKSTKKVYEYWRLCESYCLSHKTRHRAIVSLSLVSYKDTRDKKKALADFTESLLMSSSPLFLEKVETKLEALAQFFSNKILSKKTIAQDALLSLKSETTDFNELVVGNYRNGNLDSILTEGCEK